MLSNKLFTLDECYFNIPDDFNGTLGDALMLLAKYRLECESKEKSNKEDIDDSYKYLITHDDIKCTLVYRLLKLSDDKTSWDNL